MLSLTELESRLGKDASLKYWNKTLLRAAFSSIPYPEMWEVARGILVSMPQPISQVCGPISSGGYGSIARNLDTFNRTIQKLASNGETVFNQMPFEGPMQDLKARNPLSAEESDTLLLDGFYAPLFESGLIKKLHFIYGWESSFGAKWEHRQAERLGIGVNYLEKGFHDK